MLKGWRGGSGQMTWITHRNQTGVWYKPSWEAVQWTSKSLATKYSCPLVPDPSGSLVLLSWNLAFTTNTPRCRTQHLFSSPLTSCCPMASVSKVDLNVDPPKKRKWLSRPTCPLSILASSLVFRFFCLVSLLVFFPFLSLSHQYSIPGPLHLRFPLEDLNFLSLLLSSRAPFLLSSWHADSTTLSWKQSVLGLTGSTSLEHTILGRLGGSVG